MPRVKRCYNRLYVLWFVDLAILFGMKMKLFYFDFRAKGEMIRLLLHLAGVEFEDHRISREQWQTQKNEFTFGQVPVLELDGAGQRFAQSTAILTYLAKEYGYYGTSNIERLEIDQVLELIQDLWRDYVDAFYEVDQLLRDKKMEIVNNVKKPHVFSCLERLLGDNGTGWLVSNSLTCADVAVFSVIEDQDTVSAYPHLARLKEKIQNIPNIQKYLATRPESPY
ncbi:glutathione S-transferase 1 [Aplysia californica]|uniref:Glutathione S-transferase 1 n=1 Tax=Aplysia californica TaxID=6500 RepID=A0ABM1ADM8_APLCA|nr:glutathione S-transferase 1 [Aplysia californica]